MNYWAGVITGMCCSVIIFICLMLSIIAQNNVLKQQLTELDKKVVEHEKIMKAYEFYNWHYSLQFTEESE